MTTNQEELHFIYKALCLPNYQLVDLESNLSKIEFPTWRGQIYSGIPGNSDSVVDFYLKTLDVRGTTQKGLYVDNFCLGLFTANIPNSAQGMSLRVEKLGTFETLFECTDGRRPAYNIGDDFLGHININTVLKLSDTPFARLSSHSICSLYNLEVSRPTLRTGLLPSQDSLDSERQVANQKYIHLIKDILCISMCISKL